MDQPQIRQEQRPRSSLAASRASVCELPYSDLCFAPMFAVFKKTSSAQPLRAGSRIMGLDPNANTSVAGIVSGKSAFPFIARGFHYPAKIVVERPLQARHGFELDQFRFDSAKTPHP
jgi:hypothetical protein